nr:MAG TPA: hypothetical protein [Caudoviricetes sp.]
MFSSVISLSFRKIFRLPCNSVLFHLRATKKCLSAIFFQITNRHLVIKHLALKLNILFTTKQQILFKLSLYT